MKGRSTFHIFLLLVVLLTFAPPPKRLLGKSSEYVNAYVDSYAKEIKGQRVILILKGIGVSWLAIGLMSMELSFSYP